MIAASDPLEYTPGGRQTVLRHPGSVNTQVPNNPLILGESTLLQKFSQVHISDKTPKEFWSIRDNESCEEEELFCSGKIAVHTKGSQSTRVLQTSYTCETDVKHALWCTFHTATKDHMLKNPRATNKECSAGATVQCICLLDSYTLKVFSETGDDYVSSLQFQVSTVWPTKYGILMEKFQGGSNASRFTSMEMSRSSLHTADTNLPVAFSLMHPLDEICPLLIKYSNGSVSFICDTNLQIVFTNSEPSLAMLYDTKTGLHSIYKIRKALAEECQIVVGAHDTTPSLFTPSNILPLAVGNNLSMKTCANKTHLSIFGASTSPFGSRTSYGTPCSGSISSPSQQQQHQQQLHSRSHSPMATISRCQSPTNSAFSPLAGTTGSAAHQTRLHQTIMASAIGQHSSIQNSSIQIQDVGTSPSRPLIPDICLDHIWTESSGVPKETFSAQASKVFLIKDLVGQTYLSYLIPSQYQLCLVRLEKTNEPEQIIFGMVTNLVAKDVVAIPKLNMMAVMDLQSGITLYSGATYVGKIHIPCPVTSLSTSSFTMSGMSNHKLLSPFPRRSSLISPHCASSVDLKLEEGLHMLSPVDFACGRPLNMLDSSLMDTHPQALKDAVANKLILEYANKTYYRVSLPTNNSSPLVLKCLQTLQYVLQRDLAMQLLVKWYGARNAPGPQDMTLNQEWDLFLIILFGLLGYDVDKLYLTGMNDSDLPTERNSPIVMPKKQKTNNSGSQDDWAFVVNSTAHKSTEPFLRNILGLKKSSGAVPQNFDFAGNQEKQGKVNTQAALFPYLPLVLFSLHLLYEELKLNTVLSESLPLLAKLLHQLSSDLNLDSYARHYFLDFPLLCKTNKGTSQISPADLQKIVPLNFMSPEPPSIFRSLYDLLNYTSVTPYPYLSRVNSISRRLIWLFAMISYQDQSTLEIDKLIKVIVPTGSHEKEKLTGKVEQPTADRIVLRYHEMGMTKDDLEILPVGIALVLKDIMHKCREQPPSDWPTAAYELVGRHDLAALEKHSTPVAPDDCVETAARNYPLHDPDNDDGMEFDDTVFKLRFDKDHRVAEVRRLLISSKPMKIAIVQRPDVSDHEFIEEQERYLHALCTRTMALPVARGMFTLRTSTPIITEQLPIPRLCLTGKAPPRGTTVELSHIDVPPNMNLWPLFHNGVAAGLCIHPDATNVDSTWIVYNKQQQGDFGIEHSGFLMALGLNGHLKNLAPFSMYEYLVECHEVTSVGLLLGLSATHRASMDVSMTKLLSLHVETLLPPTSIELNVQQNVQIAALMGVGLVYQGTSHRHIAHALLAEIGRPPGPEMKNCVDRESYSLSAGLALGTVVLGSGGGADLANIPDTLHYYMVGGNVRPFTGAQKDKYKSPSYQIREGDSINIDVTSPGATIALGLMYLRTGNRAVAEWMRAPDTQYLLDFVRPDLLLLRILSRSLILWDEIQPTKTWVSSHVPDIVYKHKLQKPTPEMTESVDLETINQAYCNIIAGACMALGLKYAGTANNNAFKTLYHFAEMFTALSHKSIAELAGKSTIETCLNVVLLSSAVVMAGTGNLEIMRICRHVRTRVGPASSVVTYGSHLATHMALGLLFLGGGRYTLSNSPEAVAALVISLFPKFPTHSNDNRYHLQALRHLYVLAAEPRLLLPKDIDDEKFCYATVRLTFQSDKESEGQELIHRAPCLLPQIDSLKKVELNDDRYWKVIFEKGHNWKQLRGMLGKCDALDVKQRAGCLSYMEDPYGFRSLIAQTLTSEDVIAWAARPEQITSFTIDKTVLNIVKYFLEHAEDAKDRDRHIDPHLSSHRAKAHSVDLISCTEDQECRVREMMKEMSETERHFLQIFATIAYECVVRDKISLLPIWVNFYKTIRALDSHPSSYLVWQIKLLNSRVLCSDYSNESNRLFNIESIMAIKQKLATIMDKWESVLDPHVLSYATSGVVNANDETLEKLSAYLTFYDVPCRVSQEALMNPLTTVDSVAEVPVATLYKLHRLWKNRKQ